LSSSADLKSERAPLARVARNRADAAPVLEALRAQGAEIDTTTQDRDQGGYFTADARVLTYWD